jgi:DNA gyrase subunit A
MVVRTKIKDISVMGRATQGVRVIRLDEGDRVVSVARVEPEKDEEESAGD